MSGASSGLGAAYARSLAERGHPLLLVARREDRLRDLAGELSAAHGVDARWAVCDLSAAEGRAACRKAIDAWAGPVEVVVANAGFGTRGAFAELDREREVAEVELNCVAVLDLARHTLPRLLERGRGDLVVVSSVAAFQPLPYMATYAATKAFELRLAEALAGEVRGTGVRVIAVCPGPTRTEFTTGATSRSPRIPMDRAEDVVAATWRALDAGRRRVSTGWLARLTGPAVRIAPRGLVLRVSGALNRVR